MSNAPDVSILVISYNTRDLTVACLRSVFEQSKHGWVQIDDAEHFQQGSVHKPLT